MKSSALAFVLLFIFLSVMAVGAQADLIVNGSFETGNFSGWTVQNMPNPFAPWSVETGDTTHQAQRGTKVAIHGFDGGGPGSFVLYQTVTLPSTIGANEILELRWRDRTQWSMATYGGTMDRYAKVEIQDSNGNLLDEIWRFTAKAATDGDSGWNLHSVGLNKYAGQTIRVAFVSYIPQSFTGPAQYALDDITLTVRTDSGTNAVTNGSFETGDFTGWTTSQPTSPLQPWTIADQSSSTPQRGAKLAQNGFDGSAGEFVMYQDITIPSTTSTEQMVELSWRDSISWSMATYGATQDRIFTVELRDSTNTTIAELYRFTLKAGTDDITGWQTHSIGLNAWQGQSLRLTFREVVPENFTGPASFSIDDIGVRLRTPTLTNLVADGSFESGSFSSWTKSDMPNPYGAYTVVTSPASGIWEPQRGDKLAANGFDGGGPGEYTLAQTVTLPSITGNGIIELSWRDSIFWDMATYAAMLPRVFSVDILDSSDNVLATVHSKRLEPSTSGSTGWILHRVSLNTWAGQTVKLMFRHYVPESFTGPANFSIDDIRIESLTTTAGGTTVSGTVESVGGDVLPNISVTLQLADGTTMKTKTNQFGRFSFEGVPAGSNAVISVNSKKYSFSQTSQFRSVTADVSDIRFIASN